MTVTNEPFQPVRLYYSIPDRDSVSRRLCSPECLVEVPEERCWQWLFHAEAASLRFGGGYEDVPEERRPPYLGSECTAMRCRLVNRLFAGEEGRLEELMKILDENVTVIDPREAEAAFTRQFKHVRTKEDAERVAAESLERRLQSKEDVPLIEDFPLASVERATAQLESRGYRMLLKNKKEPWGQTVSRFISPEGLLVGLTYTPWMREAK